VTAAAGLSIDVCDPRGPVARALIAELDEYLNALYPPQNNYLDPADELAKAHVRFVVASWGGAPIGCGAVKSMPERYGEIKRVFVRPAGRGHGVARRIMSDLESHLVANRITEARLETGVHQPEALALYEALGYRRIGRFGEYRDDPLSIFMGKRLVAGKARWT
jgi:putative acetyltransferase